MSSVSVRPVIPQIRGNNGYPTTSDEYVSESDPHRRLMNRLIDALALYYAEDPTVYVTGNLLVFYDRGNRLRHVSPDVFVARGVGRGDRLNYLVWEERRGPEFVIELVSDSTHDEDIVTKRALYQDVLRVREYFLFDRTGAHITPCLQGFRLRRGVYRPIPATAGRLPSRVTGVHLEESGDQLLLWDPAAGRYLPTEAVARVEAEAERDQEAAARIAAETALAAAEAARAAAEERAARAEARLAELERRQRGDGDG